MKFLKSQRGQSLVELAISLVILLWLLSGAAEFGVALFQYVQLRDAAQEGALYGSLHPDDVAGITDRIKGASNSPLNLPARIDDGSVVVSISIDGNASGTPTYDTLDCEGNGLKVELTYQHAIFMPFMRNILGQDNIELKASVTDTILQPLACT